MQMAVCSCDESYLGAFKRREKIVLDERRLPRRIEVDKDLGDVVKVLTALPKHFRLIGNPNDTILAYVAFEVTTDRPLDYVHSVIEGAAGETVFIC